MDDPDFDLPPPPDSSSSASAAPAPADNVFLLRASKFGSPSARESASAAPKAADPPKPAADSDGPPAPAPASAATTASPGGYKKPMKFGAKVEATPEPVKPVPSSNPYGRPSDSSSPPSSNPYSKSGAMPGYESVQVSLPAPTGYVSPSTSAAAKKLAFPVSVAAPKPAVVEAPKPVVAAASKPIKRFAAPADSDLPPPPGDDDLPPPPGGGDDELPPPPDEPVPSEKKESVVERMRRLNMAQTSVSVAASTGKPVAQAQPQPAQRRPGGPDAPVMIGTGANGMPLFQMPSSGGGGMVPEAPVSSYCGICGGGISGSALTVGDVDYHPGCFVCRACKKPLTGEMLAVGSAFYHPGCLACSHCKASLVNKPMASSPRGELFCADHARMAKGQAGDAACMGCMRPIAATERQVAALNGKWHQSCFACETCKTPLEGKQAIVNNGKPYCEADFKSQFQTTCQGCSKVVSGGNVMEVDTGDGGTLSYHPSCFECATCKKRLKGLPFYAIGKNIFCEAHAQQ